MLSVYISDRRGGTHVDSEATSRYVDNMIEKVAVASKRIEVCYLFSYSSAFWGYWVHPAPNVRRLVVEGGNMADANLFGAELTQLRKMSFSYGFLSLANSQYLTSVEIRGGNQPISLNTFLDGFRGCEALESLVLHAFDTLLVGDTPNPPTAFSLPNLRRLNLFYCDSRIILGYVTFVSLSEPLIIFNSTPYRDILHCIPQNYRSTAFLQNLEKLQVILNSRRSQYSVSAYRGNGELALYIGVSDVASWLRRGWIRASFDAVACFRPFSTVYVLLIATDDIVRSWDPWLVSSHNLRYLNVTSPDTGELLRALLTPDPETRLPVCRTLRTLALHRCGRRTLIDYTNLKRVVLSRWTARSPLEQVVIHENEWKYMKYVDTSWVDLVGSQSTSRS